MIVRDARPADIPAVHRLIGQLADAPDDAAFSARFERVFADNGHRIVVAEIGGKVVGSAVRAPPKALRAWQACGRQRVVGYRQKAICRPDGPRLCSMKRL